MTRDRTCGSGFPVVTVTLRHVTCRSGFPAAMICVALLLGCSAWRPLTRARSLESVAQCKQDLHGYDATWRDTSFVSGTDPNGTWPAKHVALEQCSGGRTLEVLGEPGWTPPFGHERYRWVLRNGFA